MDRIPPSITSSGPIQGPDLPKDPTQAAIKATQPSLKAPSLTSSAADPKTLFPTGAGTLQFAQFVAKIYAG